MSAIDAARAARVVLAEPGPCRVCGDPAWLADATRPVHPCCLLWAEFAAGRACPSCGESRRYWRTKGRR